MSDIRSPGWNESGHLLRLVEISDEGWTKFEVVCPFEGKGPRPCMMIDLDKQYRDEESGELVGGETDGCYLAYALKEIGNEIIVGTAPGNGPWPVAHDDFGDGEVWIALTQDPRYKERARETAR